MAATSGSFPITDSKWHRALRLSASGSAIIRSMRKVLLIVVSRSILVKCKLPMRRCAFFMALLAPFVENRSSSVRVHHSERLRETLALANGCYLVLVGLLEPIRHLDRFPPGHMNIRPFTKVSR